MQITNEILLGFIHCPYKAYRKYTSESGSISSYEKLSNELKYSQKLLFSEMLSSEKKLIKTKPAENNFTFNTGAILDPKFSNSNIEIIPDSIEFIGKNKIIPILITPFEKITKTDKLFVSFQATYLQSEFHFQIEHCKIVFGKNFKQTKFRLTSFSKAIKKNITELNKTLLQTNSPIYYRNSHCQICEFQNSCIEKLKERDDLSLLTGLKPKEILQKNNRGIFSVRQLSYSFRPKKNPYRRRKFLPELKALAIREQKTFIQQIPTFKNITTEIFIDIEGIPDRNFNYLIGVIIKAEGITTEYSFWANNKEEEENIFIQLINLISSIDDYVIFHYGSFEIQAFKNISKSISAQHQDLMKRIIDKSFNILSIFSNDVYPPTYTNGLKDIANFLKFEWSEEKASGLQSLVWRYKWELNKNEELKYTLLKYNIEDCRALLKVKEWLTSLNGNNTNEQLTKSLKDHNIFKWGVTVFAVEHFNEK